MSPAPNVDNARHPVREPFNNVRTENFADWEREK